jgi:elongator complex protein 3
MEEIIKKILKSKPKTEKELLKLKREAAKKSGQPILSNAELRKGYLKLLDEGVIKPNVAFEKLLRKRAIRTLSGIAPVAVLTKPFPCPGKCAYCPHEKDVPTSYLSNEPAVMRAIRNKYNPYDQVRMRLIALEANGHKPEKIELIVIGGTWSALPDAYKFWFIKECFRAANEFQIKNKKEKRKNKESKNFSKLKIELASEQKKNETAQYNIVGVTLETRPDYVNEKELIEMRELGCTRVEIGVQAIDDKILKINKRGHGVAEIAQATKLLKDFGFKVTYHLMPGLPGATAKKDLAMFKQLFSDERFQPDQIKFYPTVVTRGSLLYRWWRAGKYKPYSDKVLQNLIVECKKIVPPYVRIIRLIRDIPGESIEAGNMITNLRQVMQQRGVACRCIRCRECREEKFKEENLKLNVLKYPSSGGQEFFISFDSLDGKTLYGFCRLRLPAVVVARSFTTKQSCASQKTTRLFRSARNDKYEFLNNSAIVRELHVYGELVPMGDKKKTQHGGLGTRLLAEAEKIARENDFKQLAVISGVGVRNYYKKFGYKLKNTYLVKGI